MNKIIELIKQVFINKLKRIYFYVFIISFIIAETSREIYRPYIYKNDINDFGFADTVGNSFGTIAIIFFIFSLIIKDDFRKEVAFIFAIAGILLLYELYQGLIPNYYFDIKDVLATIIAGAISFVIYKLINMNYKNDVGK